MLVLSRHRDETIVIGPFLFVNPKTGQTEEVQVELTVVDIRGDEVRFGVEAPRDIPVHRLEVHEAILEEKAEAKKKNKRLKRQD